MTKAYGLTKLFATTGALLAASAAYADSIAPTTFSATVGVGGSATVHKVVTVTEGPATSSKVDVFFLADTTGSMGGPIASVKASASAIMTAASGLGDVNFGVGEYKDNSDYGPGVSYRLNQNITGSTVATQAGINLWSASGGGDFPEQGLHALTLMSTGAAWRAGSARIAVMFADATFHDPGAGGETLASTIAALNAKGVKVLMVDVGGMNGLGQATAIAAATGGSYQAGVNSATIVAAINAAITSSFSTYTKVDLDLSEAPAGVSVTKTAASVGSYDRSITRTFDFDVTFTGVSPGTYDFSIYGTVDGGRVATEKDHIVVGVPDSASSLLLLGAALSGVALLRRRTQRRV